MSAGQLDAANEAASTQLTQNSLALAGCQSGWAGSAFVAFERVRETWETADAARTDLLAGIALDLYRGADIYDYGDESSAAGIDSTM
ncbi:hypothetical protein ACWDUN_12670 [Mycobacterium sp. NPDC003323]